MGRGRGNSGKGKTLTANPISLAVNLRANHRDKTRRKAFDSAYGYEHPSFTMIRYNDKFLYNKLSERGPSYFDPDTDIDSYANLVLENVHKQGAIGPKDFNLYFDIYDYTRFRNFESFFDSGKRIKLVEKQYRAQDLKDLLDPLQKERFDTDAIVKDYNKFFSEAFYAENLVDQALKSAISDPDIDKNEVEKEAVNQTVDANLNYIISNWPSQRKVLLDPRMHSREALGSALASLLQYGNSQNDYTSSSFFRTKQDPDVIKPLEAYEVREYIDGDQDALDDACRYTHLPKRDFIEAYNVLVEKEAEDRKL